MGYFKYNTPNLLIKQVQYQADLAPILTTLWSQTMAFQFNNYRHRENSIICDLKYHKMMNISRKW
jgi:hypothetical protein